MKCSTCGYDGKPENDFWCGNPDCGDYLPDPEADKEMEAYASLMDLIHGAFDEDPDLRCRIAEDLRIYYGK
jgi:hypothetical protein